MGFELLIKLLYTSDRKLLSPGVPTVKAAMGKYLEICSTAYLRSRLESWLSQILIWQFPFGYRHGSM